jgi:hypothetical protein
VWLERAYATSCKDGPESGRWAWAMTQLTAKRVKSWSVRCWSAVGTRPHPWAGATCKGVETVETIMEPPPRGTRRYMLCALIIQGVPRVEGPRGVRRGGDTPPLAAARHKAYDLPQPIECEQGRWVLWRRICRRARVVSRTHGECGVGPSREPHDEVRISPLPAPDQCDALAAERVMWMGDSHRFRRRLGQWGSVL